MSDHGVWEVGDDVSYDEIAAWARTRGGVEVFESEGDDSSALRAGWHLPASRSQASGRPCALWYIEDPDNELFVVILVGDDDGAALASIRETIKLGLAKRWCDHLPCHVEAAFHHGLSLTTLMRHEEAIDAYSRAIALDEGDDRGDDRNADEGFNAGSAYFNRACERANLGHRSQDVFDDLRQAVARSGNLGDSARKDEYLRGVVDDPRFDEAIARGTLEFDEKYPPPPWMKG